MEALRAEIAVLAGHQVRTRRWVSLLLVVALAGLAFELWRWHVI
jgi:hypothetical protein